MAKVKVGAGGRLGVKPIETLAEIQPIKVGQLVEGATAAAGFFTVDADGLLVQSTVDTSVSVGQDLGGGVANGVVYLDGSSQFATNALFTYSPSVGFSVGVTSGYTGRLFELIENGGRVFQYYAGKFGVNVAGAPQATIHSKSLYNYVALLIEGANSQDVDYVNIKSYTGTLLTNMTSTGGWNFTSTGSIAGGWNEGVNIKGVAPTVRLTDSLYGFGFFKDGVISYIAETSDGWSSNSIIGSFRGANFGMGTTNPQARGHFVGGGSGTLGGDRVAILEGNLPELHFRDTNNSESVYFAKYGSSFYIGRASLSGTPLNYAGLIQQSTGKWTIGSGANPGAHLDIKVQVSTNIGQIIQLANSQIANAFEINSYVGSSGDTYQITSTGQHLGVLGTTSTPTWSFIGDIDTGILSPYANAVSIVGGSVTYAEFSPGAIQVYKAIRQNTGWGASNIGFHWTGDTNSGLIHGTGANEIGIATDGVGRLMVSNGGVNINNLPTSSAGLSAGDLYNDSGTVKIV